MNVTITDLAREFDMEPHAVRAALDLGDTLTDGTPIDEFDGWTEAEAREVLAMLATQAEDLG